MLSATKSPRLESSSSPMGVSKDAGSLAICMISITLSSDISSASASSETDGSYPSSRVSFLCILDILLMVSTICTGTRMVRAWSARALVTDWRIHQVAYVLNL